MPYYHGARVLGGIMVLAMALATFVRGDDERPRAEAVSPAPTSARYMLLSNGQLLYGTVEEKEDAFILTQRVGTLKIPHSRVEGIFATVDEAFEYKLEQFPEGDSSERIKLVHWCLNQGLREQARKQLGIILAKNPADPEAKAMLVSMDQADARLAMRARDPEIQRTKADPESLNPRPRTLEPGVIHVAQTAMGIQTTPVIFDLPKPLAIRRGEEFTRFVHPLLQVYCAKCHSENYEGSFQLVPVRTRAQRTPDALRANLDATLRLVDHENPAKSVLLSSALRPHGNGPNKRPIFPGSNDRAYQVLASWVNKLGASPSDGKPAVESGRPNSVPEEIFAASRNRAMQNAPRLPGNRGAGRNLPAPAIDPTRLGSRQPGPGLAAPGMIEEDEDEDDGDADQFPLPFAVTGKMPKLPTQPHEVTPGAVGGKPLQNNLSPSDPRVRPAGSARESRIPPPRTIDSRPSANLKDKDKDDKPKSRPKTPSRPLKIDSSVFERALQIRNGAGGGE